MLLTSDLAQKIVASIMSITHENINIMDNQGVIIASGQPHRLHTFHQGAKEAIDRDETVIIHGSRVASLPLSYKRYLENFLRKRFKLRAPLAYHVLRVVLVLALVAWLLSPWLPAMP